VSAPEEKCAPLGACVRELDGVLESHRVTGTDRLILKIVARSIAHLDDIIGTLARYGTPIMSIVLASKSRPIRAGVRGN
jgi:DNA-binding Lrp family transcriptional regulator